MVDLGNGLKVVTNDEFNGIEFRNLFRAVLGFAMAASVLIYLWVMKLVWNIEQIIQSTEGLFDHLKQEDIEAAQAKLR